MNSSRRARDRRVVVTGLGTVSAAGWGVGPLRQAVRSGRTSIGPFNRFDHTAQRTHVAGQAPLPPRPAATKDPVPHHRLSHSDRFALFSAHEAVTQAGLTLPLEGRSAGVFFGGSTGGLFEAERYFEQLVRHPGSSPPRTLLASHVISAPAETVARHLGIEGPVETVSSACASGNLAIEQALRAIRDAEVDIALAGGADSLCVTTYAGFNSLRAVDERPCRPFRADRAGMSLGEGGAVLVLESLDHAQARGARPLAEILGAGSSCDADHMTAPQAKGTWASVAIERALADAGVEPGDIDCINAHGTGTALNDVAECAGLRRAFGARMQNIPVEATKGVVGHLLGAAGAVATLTVILGLLDREVHPTPGGGDIDPALDVHLVLDGPRSMPDLRTAISVSLGFGGANAAVVLGRWEQA